MPVTGDLNEPQFSLGPLVWKAFANLIAKATTAPFRALGSLLGGESEQFNGLVFEPGDTVLLPPEEEKLAKLADASRAGRNLSWSSRGGTTPRPMA